jgi:hypothetical protein
MKRILLTMLLLLNAGVGFAETSSSLNLSIPNTQQSYQSDSFDAGELRCSNAIGSATQLEYGVTGIVNQGSNYDAEQGAIRDIGLYARITIPLGKTAKSRIDCNRLYELELQKKQLELQKLQQELEQLQMLQLEEEP